MTLLAAIMESGSAEAAESGGGMGAIYIALVVLAILLGAMVALLAFAGGRDHS